jgi:hypothetical protein
MRHEESILQRQCVSWFRLQYPKHVIFAIPNGGARGRVEAAIMHGEGVLAGAADLFVMHGSNGKHGLFIEMKSEQGRQSASQRFFGKAAEDESYKYEVCRTFDEFMMVVNDYLNK